MDIILHTNFSGITLILLAAIFLCSTCTIIYRLYFHPLSHFPGPKLAAATKWYECYFDVLKGEGGQYFRRISEMHDHYGSIVRINPDELHIRDASQYEIIYSGKRDLWPPAAAMAGMDKHTFGTVPHDLHRRRKAANMPLMGKRVVVDAVPMIRSHVVKLRTAFAAAAESGKALELGVTFLAYTSDIVGRYFFDQSLGMQVDSLKAQQWKTASRKMITMAPIVKQFPGILKPALMMPPSVMNWLAPEMAALMGIHHNMQARATSYLKDAEHGSARSGGDVKAGRPTTLFDSIYEHPAPPEEKSVTRLFQEGVNVIIAGSETTARVMTRAIYELTANPDVMSRARQELKAEAARVGRPVEELTLNELEHLPWLAAVLKESLRMAAIVTSRLPRCPHEPMQYKQWTIPAMTPVSLTPHDVLHDPTVYALPERFYPERWLTTSDDGSLALHSDLERFFVIFGKGPRMCQGINLAYAEMYFAIATLITAFDFELFDVVRERDIDYTSDCFLGEARADSPGVWVFCNKEDIQPSYSVPGDSMQ
ncbi:hypothetical protein LTR08_005240 [Meristemomyces frigidus]|nr:hypothetical protein LTR08_005240 [Meristemomyces frigidus]